MSTFFTAVGKNDVNYGETVSPEDAMVALRGFAKYFGCEIGKVIKLEKDLNAKGPGSKAHQILESLQALCPADENLQKHDLVVKGTAIVYDQCSVTIGPYDLTLPAFEAVHQCQASIDPLEETAEVDGRILPLEQYLAARIALQGVGGCKECQEQWLKHTRLANT